MLSTSVLVVAIVLGSAVQPFEPLQSSPASPSAPGGGLSQADLEELVAPIALYPDPLLANVLAASVYPDEVKAAGAWVARGGGADQIEGQNWEPSVKAVASVPDALTMLVNFPEWTAAVGRAYLTQGPALMNAVQALRTKAWDNGALRNTPEQVVVKEGDTIIIQPASPQVLYVPQYNPQVVYTTVVQSDPGATAAAGLIGFGLGVAVGAIIANNVDCDWNHGYVCWGGGYYHGYRGGWSHSDVDIDINRNTNINIGNNNTVVRPGGEGGQWRPNASKASTTAGSALDGFRGVGEGRQPAAGRIPGRTDNTPIATQRPASRPVDRAGANADRGARPTSLPQRPDAPAGQKPRPDRGQIPGAQPATMPTRMPNAPSGFDLDKGSKDLGTRGKQSLGGSKYGSSSAPKPQAKPASRPSAPTMKPASRPAPRPSSGGRGGGGGGRR